MNKKIIIHVDMDAFYASVEMRDNPYLQDKALIIGSLPNERGVVSTCNYKAREYGVHSAMNIKEAYKLCPKGVYMHPNFEKYKKVSNQIHEIWNTYASKSEAIALDEAYLDVTEKVEDIEGARKIAHLIKERIKNEIGLTCSVGLGYSKIAAKTASEEKKPNGYYEILTKDDFVNLVIDRDVNSLYTVGKKTTEKLNNYGIYKVKDIQNNRDKVIKMFGKKGELLFYKKLKNYIDVLNDKYNLNIDLYFVSQDVNDSLNYDMLVYIPETGEAHVIEVKTTTILDQYNNISLSSREYNKYLKGMNTRKGGSLYKRFTSYNIVRLYIKDDHIERLTLLTKNNDYFKCIMDLIGSSKIYVDYYNSDVSIGSYIDTSKDFFSIGSEKNKLSDLDKTIFNNSILNTLHENISNYSEMLELSKNQVIDADIMKKILK